MHTLERIPRSPLPFGNAELARPIGAKYSLGREGAYSAKAVYICVCSTEAICFVFLKASLGLGWGFLVIPYL